MFLLCQSLHKKHFIVHSRNKYTEKLAPFNFKASFPPTASPVRFWTMIWQNRMHLVKCLTKNDQLRSSAWVAWTRSSRGSAVIDNHYRGTLAFRRRRVRPTPLQKNDFAVKIILGMHLTQPTPTNTKSWILLDSTVAAVYDRRWLTPALIETPLQVKTSR